MPTLTEPSESTTEAGRDPESGGPDYRMVIPAIAAWGVGAFATTREPRELAIAATVTGGAAAIAVYRGRRLIAVTLVVVAVVCAVVALRVTAVTTGPVAALAAKDASAQVTLDIVGDPRAIESSFGDSVFFHARITHVEGRGVAADTREPVLVFGPDDWSKAELGQSVTTSGVLGAPESTNEAAVLDASSTYRVLEEPAWWWAGADTLRAGVTSSVEPRSDDVAGLVPALVHGDDRDLPDDLADDFQTSGLTHLLAVSGTNLTLVVGFLLLVARQCGIRGRGQLLLGVAGTVGFVLLARPEPSVVRAAAMGLVALAGLGAGGRRRGMRSLAWAVIGLLLLDPWLSRTVGFVLSVCATAGILILAPAWRDRLARWMPRWCAEAIAVPTAAQLACTPVVAVVSEQVCLVAVVANLLAAPAVGPATVLGLTGGVAAVVSEPVGYLVGRVTGLFAGWIVLVGHQAAALPGAAIEWKVSPASIAALGLVCGLLAISLHWALTRPWVCIPAAALIGVVLIRPISVGWPPPDWAMVMCDVGQGDAVVLNAGNGEAVVVDTGPEPQPVDACLSGLGIDRIPLVVLTHAHADHTGGLSGVTDGRTVGAIGVSELGPHPRTSVPVTTMPLGAEQSVGDVTWTVLGPPTGAARPVESSDGSVVNDSSVVLLAEVQGVTILLTGDVEPGAQAALLEAAPDLHAEVLKVPHHGSGSQDPALFEQLGADYALISVGADNTYGHPAPSMLDLAEDNGIRVVRTDQSGTLAVTSDNGRPIVQAR